MTEFKKEIDSAMRCIDILFKADKISLKNYIILSVCLYETFENEMQKENSYKIKLPYKIGESLYLISSGANNKNCICKFTFTKENSANVLSRIENDIYTNREAAEKALKNRKIPQRLNKKEYIKNE
ncbi:MAG: hypothetical protein RR355_00120 [Oscillospiraceae bacterium]